MSGRKEGLDVGGGMEGCGGVCVWGGGCLGHYMMWEALPPLQVHYHRKQCEPEMSCQKTHCVGQRSWQLCFKGAC